jgi:glucuronate isomerase
MKPFMNEDFLLNSEAARALYHNHAKTQPIADVHCHIDPKEIATDKRYANLTRVWLAGDHYKWRLMRANGVEEKYITGDAPDEEKFIKFAETMPKAVGNPVYHWAHLELRRYFDCGLDINGQNAEAIWAVANRRLEALTAREIIRRSDVRLIATTDDPADDLRWHKAIRDDPSFDVKVVPTFRPDRLLSEGADRGYLEERAEFFHSMGCRSADHGLAAIPAAGEMELFLFLAGVYKRLGWVMQLHYGVARGVHARLARTLGPDTGFDSIGPAGGGNNLAPFLSALSDNGCLPKTVVYSLDPNDNTMIDTVLGCFPGTMHGPAWWFNDTKNGIERHLADLAANSLLGSFIGMLTDSRSLLSYTRHEYFRRILCSMLGQWAENGEIPFDEAALGSLVRDISYHNAKRYFGF